MSFKHVYFVKEGNRLDNEHFLVKDEFISELVKSHTEKLVSYTVANPTFFLTNLGKTIEGDWHVLVLNSLVNEIVEIR